MHKELTIITVNYFSADLIKKLADTMPNRKSFDYNWIVVDNSEDMAQAKALKKISKIDRIIIQKHNVGFGAANNIGTKNSKSNYYLFLNPDTTLISGSLEKLLLFMKNNTDYAMAGPKILNNDGSIQLSAAKKYPYWWSHAIDYSPLLRLLVGKFGFNQYPTMYTFKDHDKDLDPNALLGACIMVVAKDFNRVKGFDSKFFMYREETDLSRRLIKNNKKIKYLSEAKIFHVSGGSSKNNFYAELNPLYIKSSYMFLSKWHNPLYVVMCWLIGITGLITSLIFFCIAGITIPNKRKDYFRIAKICLQCTLNHLVHPFAIGYYIR